MEKTYEALIERLEKCLNWKRDCVRCMEGQADLNDYEKEYIIRNKAKAELLERILFVEQESTTCLY